MSESVAGSQNNDAGSEVVEPVNVASSDKGAIEDKVSYNSYKQLMDQHKTAKAKLNELSKTLEQFEREKLEREGKTEELVIKEREQNKQLLDQMSQLKTKTLKANVVSTLAKKAKDAHSIDDLLALPQAAAIEYNEDTLEPDMASIESFVNTLREEKPYLFGSKKVAPMADGKPSGEKPQQKKLTMEEALKAALIPT